jgi:hypothetical protein
MYNPGVYAKRGLLYLLYSNVNINSGVYLPSRRHFYTERRLRFCLELVVLSGTPSIDFDS